MLSVRKIGLSLLGCALLSFTALTPSRAAVTFTLGNNPQADEENILFGASESGTSIAGATNTSHTSVLFSSTTDTLLQNAQGQADIFASDGLVNNLTITSPGNTFQDLIMNPMDGSGSTTVTVLTNLNTYTFNYPTSGPGAIGNGQNFLTIVADGSDKILSATIDASSGFDNFKQPRISGLDTVHETAVPEPGALSLVAGMAISGTGLAFRRLRRR